MVMEGFGCTGLYGCTAVEWRGESAAACVRSAWSDAVFVESLARR
jgi:hypothetical protein